MQNNDEYDDDWVDDDTPVYRSLSIAQPSYDTGNFDQATFGDDDSKDMMAQSMQTYDGEDEPPVYRSLSVAAPSNPHAFGGFNPNPEFQMPAMNMMGASMTANQKTMASNYPSVSPSAVPISTSFLDQCHVYAKGNKDEIAHRVSEFLTEWGVDFVFKANKAKWKCVHYDCGQHVDFRVRLYLPVDSNQDVFPLEFQRRQGPLLQFNRMYQNATYTLSQAGFLRDPVRQPNKPLPMPSLPASAPQIIDSGVERLVEMAKSPMEDVKHQALITLSKLSPKPEYQESLLRSAPVVPTMHSCFASNAHVRRCAVTILADMCSSSAGQRSVASGLGITQGQDQALHTLLKMVEGGGPSADLETRRQSCRLLARLANQCSNELTQAAQNSNAVEMLVNSDGQVDSRLRKHLVEIKEALRERGVNI